MLTAGVSVAVCGFVGAMGSVGVTTSGRLVFREEIAVLLRRHRLVLQQAWSWAVSRYRANPHSVEAALRRCMNLKGVVIMEPTSRLLFDRYWANAISIWFVLRGSVVRGQSAADGLTSTMRS